MERCPKCGSELVVINGVMQKKKDLMYYLGGQAAFDAGVRHSTKMMNVVKGNKENAKCMKCHFTWRAGHGDEKAVQDAPDAPGAPAMPPQPELKAPTGPHTRSAAADTPITLTLTPPGTPRFCRKCGARPEAGDVYCVACGAKLEP